MGAEASSTKGAGPDAPAWRGELGQAGDPKALQEQVKGLQERVRELELAASSAEAAAGGGSGSPLSRGWLELIGSEPTVGLVRLSPETCAIVDRLFAALDVNGDGTLDKKDMPRSKSEQGIRGRANSLFNPLSDFLVRGAMTPADLRRALASRACRRLVAPGSDEDTLAGWMARIQLEANAWVQRTVLEVLGDEAAERVQAPGHAPVSVGLALNRPAHGCAPLSAVAMALSNLGFPTSQDDLFESGKLPLWAVQYGRMSLAEAFHITRCHAEAKNLGCHVSMHHARPGPSGLQAFRDHVHAISTETYKGEAVGIVLLEVSTALGSRGVEGEDSLTATIHAALIDSLDGEEVVLLDTDPKRFGLRWRCGVERLHLACNSLAAHDMGHSCGGLISVSRNALQIAASAGNGQDIELLASPTGHPDCFAHAAPWMPRLPVLSSQLPCHGLVTLCAGLAAAERWSAGPDTPEDPGWPQVDVLCHQLNLPVVRVLETEQTLSELSDLALRWNKLRSLPVEVATMHCDDRLPNAASLASLLGSWAAIDPASRPVYIAQFSVAGQQGATVHMAIVVAYDQGRQVVTFGEASLRHHACTWSMPVSELWDACAAVGSFGRTGGILSLTPSPAAQAPPRHQRALADSEEKQILSSIDLPQFAVPIAATAFTSIAYGLEALLQGAVANEHGGEDDSSVQIPANLRRPVSVDDIVIMTSPVAAAGDAVFSMAEAFDASAQYVEKRALPVRVDAIFFEGLTTQQSFKEMINRAVGSTREVLMLHFSLGIARGIPSAEGQGHSALVAGYDPAGDELLLADASPKIYRREWRAPLATVYQACCAVAPPPVSRPRGAIRYSLLSRGQVQDRISQHAKAAETGAASATPQDLPPHIMSTHAIVRSLQVADSVKWDNVPPSRLPALQAVTLGMAAAGHTVSVSQLVRVCGIPPRAAHTPSWTLPDLAAVARLYIGNADLELDVQEVRFSGSQNTSEVFRREMERAKLAGNEAHMVAFNPTVAHAASAMPAPVDYAMVSEVDINSGRLELMDMNAKTNCARWTCTHQMMFDALSKSPKGNLDSLGMLRFCGTDAAIAELMLLDRVPPSQLSVAALPSPPEGEISHSAQVLQMGFSKRLNCRNDVVVLESLTDIDDVVSQDTCLPDLRDRALVCAHSQKELHRFRVDLVFCEDEQCKASDLVLEMQRHSEATGLGGKEAVVMQFDSAALFGAEAASMNLLPADWALVVAADPSTVTLAMFDGAERVVSTKKLWAACHAQHRATSRSMGFIRIAMVTAAPVFAKRFSTINVDGPIAWALHGDRVVAVPPPPEPTAAPPDPVSAACRDAGVFPSRQKREETFERLDDNGNGRLSLAEAANAIEDLWPSFSHPTSITTAFQTADVDGNGLITRTEFAALLRALAYYSELREQFGQDWSSEDRDPRLVAEQVGDALLKLEPTAEGTDATSDFKKLHSDSDGSVALHKLCGWLARRHACYDADSGERVVATEEKMVKSAENYYTPDESVLGSAPCVPIIACLRAPEFATLLPCTPLVAIGFCCDALNSMESDATSHTARMVETDVDSIYRTIELGISQVLGLRQSQTASQSRTTQLFHRREPSAPVESCVSIGIVQCENIANRLFRASEDKPFLAEAVYFERSATSEAAFRQFLGASRTRQAGENRELSIVFFNAQTTHGVSGLGGCSVGILADFNEEADTVLIADMVPSKYGRFWSCSSRRLCKPCPNHAPATSHAANYSCV